MAIVYELATKQDLDLGVGQVVRTNPGGGQMQADQINLASLAQALLVTGATTGFTVQTGNAPTILVIPFPGAVAGNLVLFSHDQIQSVGLLVSAFAGTNQVVVVLYNITGVNIVVPQGNLRVLVFAVP